MQTNLSTNQDVPNVLVRQDQKINRTVQPTYTQVDLKERTREPSDTGLPGTGTGASPVASPRITLPLEEHLCPEQAGVQQCASRM